MRSIDPSETFTGRILLLVPHMDDCVLSCGGMIARLPDKQNFFVIYATDGSGSPRPVLHSRSTAPDDLVQAREQEAVSALAFLGIPAANIRFLKLPDGHLSQYKQDLYSLLQEAAAPLNPDLILAPFRYDRHPDHLALNHAAVRLFFQSSGKTRLVEYFVYYQWRMLSQGDIRKYIRPDLLVQVDVSDVSAQKRAALDLFKSQTTRFYPWQTRPNLTPQLLDAVSQAPEVFLSFDPSLPGAAVLTHNVLWIRLAHRLEPILKERKDQVVALIRGELWKNGKR